MERVIILKNGQEAYRGIARGFARILHAGHNTMILLPLKYVDNSMFDWSANRAAVRWHFTVPESDMQYVAFSWAEQEYYYPQESPGYLGRLQRMLAACNSYYPSVWDASKVFNLDADSDVLRAEILRTHRVASMRYQRTATYVTDAFVQSLRWRCGSCEVSVTDAALVLGQRYGGFHRLGSSVYCQACLRQRRCSKCTVTMRAPEDRCERCRTCRLCCSCQRCPCGKSKIYKRAVFCHRCRECAIHKCSCRFPNQLPPKHLKAADVAFEFEFGTDADNEPPSVSRIRDRFHPATTMTDTSCPAGFELVSGPLSLDAAIDMTRNVVDYCVTNDFIHVSDSTSYHVHVNTVDLSLIQLRKLFITWCTFEDEIYTEFISRHRRGNSYAEMMTAYSELPGFIRLLKRAATPQEIRKLMLMFMYTSKPLIEMEKFVFGLTRQQQRKLGDPVFRALRTVSHEKYGVGRRQPRLSRWGSHISSRYTTLNLHSFFYRGTLEFRGKEVSFAPDDLVRWLKFCHDFVKVIRSLPENEHIKSFDQLMTLTTKGDN